MGYNGGGGGGQPNTSAALSAIQNDHAFGTHSSNSILDDSPNQNISDSAMSGAYSQSVLSSFRDLSEVDISLIYDILISKVFG